MSDKNKISRREFSKRVAATAAGMTIAAAPDITRAQQIAKSTKHKNVLMILMDQERAWATLPAGLDLPVRKKFASEGVSFEKYNIATLSCAPSRSVIYTGQHVQKTTIFTNPGLGEGDPFLDVSNTPTIGQMFKKMGYKTAYKGKWHLSVGFDEDNVEALVDYGFDEWHKGQDTGGVVYEGAEKDREILENARDYLTRQKDEKEPWFLAVNFVNPHDIMWLDANGKQAETRLRPGLVSDMRPAQDIYPYNHDFGFNVPANFYDDLSKKPEAQMEFVKLGQYFYGEQDISDEEACKNVLNYYAACLVDSDRVIGDLLATLEKLGMTDDTIVILTSDHGEMGGSHGLRHKGPFMYRENINVPLVVRYPGGQKGVKSNAMMSAIDFAPTLIGLVGEDYSKIEKRLLGYDYSGIILGKKVRERNEILVNFSNTTQGNSRLEKIRMLQKEAEKKGAPVVQFKFPDDFIQFDTRTLGRGIITERYKFSRWFAPGDHHKPTTWQMLVGRNDLELYDLDADPLEMNNLIHFPETHRELILALNTRLNDLIEREVGIDLGGHLPGNHNIWTSEL
ncbi:MAG: sulfatase-like hydrolase/transferase [Alphaproteobacteria bacterium]|nr:sulfatase-like hydrolase/transferase [Alphaproteobacteria bacterium]HPF46176.1 sulfatase-like hydrolase/transferase [Emcibacteraceae bacterium]